VKTHKIRIFPVRYQHKFSIYLVTLL
jgi:hypothetical protein